jgi:hypothetical protein
MENPDVGTMTPEQTKRLSQLLGMLGSAHDGEVLNAAKMAQRFLGGLGLTWEEALTHNGSYARCL